MASPSLPTTDPKQAAAILLSAQGMLASALKANRTVTRSEASRDMEFLIAAFLADYKETVIEELLAVQKSTNEALASAIGRKF